MNGIGGQKIWCILIITSMMYESPPSRPLAKIYATISSTQSSPRPHRCRFQTVPIHQTVPSCLVEDLITIVLFSLGTTMSLLVVADLVEALGSANLLHSCTEIDSHLGC